VCFHGPAQAAAKYTVPSSAQNPGRVKYSTRRRTITTIAARSRRKEAMRSRGDVTVLTALHSAGDGGVPGRAFFD